MAEKKNLDQDETKKVEPKPDVNEDEQQILIENAAEEYRKLPYDDPRVVRIDHTTNTFWVRSNKFKINPMGFKTKKMLGQLFDKHDDLIARYAQARDDNDTKELVTLPQLIDQTKDEIVEKAIPIMLDDGKGFNEDKWFSDEIPAGAWFTVAVECYAFLREKGSKEDILLSMIHSTSE